MMPVEAVFELESNMDASSIAGKAGMASKALSALLDELPTAVLSHAVERAWLSLTLTIVQPA